MGQIGATDVMHNGYFEDDAHRESLLAIRLDMEKSLEALTALGSHHAAVYLDLAIWQITPPRERLYELSDSAVELTMRDWK